VGVVVVKNKKSPPFSKRAFLEELINLNLQK